MQTAAVQNIQARYRVQSIDLLRGIVMIIMALDHVRDYFHWSAQLYGPLDLSHTSPYIYGQDGLLISAPQPLCSLPALQHFSRAAKGKKHCLYFYLQEDYGLFYLN